MTEKQIERIKTSIKKHRAALAAEKRKFGGYDDSAGNRYYISNLYMKMADYKGVITYKKWFDKNFPDDSGTPLLSLNWSIAFFELGQLEKAKIYTIDTAFQNIYLHDLLLDREIKRIDMYEQGYDMFEHSQAVVKYCKKVSTKSYLDWLLKFMNSDEYKKPVNKFVEISKLIKYEYNNNKRDLLLNHITYLVNMNKNN